MKGSIIGLQLIFAIALVSWRGKDISWLKKDCKSFNLNYTVADTSLKQPADEFLKWLHQGLKAIFGKFLTFPKVY